MVEEEEEEVDFLYSDGSDDGHDAFAERGLDEQKIDEVPLAPHPSPLPTPVPVPTTPVPVPGPIAPSLALALMPSLRLTPSPDQDLRAARKAFGEDAVWVQHAGALFVHFRFTPYVRVRVRV